MKDFTLPATARYGHTARVPHSRIHTSVARPIKPALSPSSGPRGAQPSVALPPPSSSIDPNRRARARWILLRFLEAAAEVGLNDSLMTEALADLCGWSTPDDMRDDIMRLCDLGLAETGDGVYGADGFARITAAGNAVVEYQSPSPAGIARPIRHQ